MNKWIPRKQELPEKSGYYLVTIKDSTFPATLYFFHSDCTWRDEHMISYPVIAWMPLPKIYVEPKL